LTHQPATSASAASPADDSAGEVPRERTRLPRGRRYGVRALLGLASLLTLLAIFAVWANRQVLDADNWADTSSALLANDDIRTQIGTFAVDAVYSSAEVQDQIAAALPPRLQPLAGPAAGALRELAERRADRTLSRPKVQEAWKAANKATAQQFINIAEDDSKAITQSGNAVVLDLRVVVAQIAAQIGLPGKAVDRLPADATKIKIMDGNQVGALQTGASLLKGLSWLLPTLAILLLAGAVYLGRGRRRETLFYAGIDLIAVGLLVLTVRRIIGDSVVDSLVKTDSVRPAAQAAWHISTRMLQQIAQACVVLGIPLVVAALLAGPLRPAVAFRRLAAPVLRDRPGIAYSVMTLLLLIIVAWGPIPATRKPLPVLLLFILSMLGVAALARQTEEEFPATTTHTAAGT
jgi:hypothetical protein